MKLFDRYLVASAVGLVCMGLLMVASASMVISDRTFGEPFYFLLHQTVFLVVGIGFSWFLFRFNMDQWKNISSQLLLLSLLLLSLVLVPGLGHEVNGSMRWLGIGPLGLQVSEFAKLAMIIYLASYLVRRHEEVKNRIRGFLKPLLIIGVMAALLLKEPDFGAMAVIVTTSLGMLFLAGVRIWQFIFLLLVAVLILAILAVSSPYRVERLTTFMNPWANAYASGYQLTQSLIAFGHGGWFGVGLGHSTQKLFYLPEAHTDFLFAVLAEELGLIGSLFIVGLYCLFVIRGLWIGYSSYRQKLFFSAYVAYGISLWLIIQAIVNIGVNTGLLPTKGLTLPLMSYGGSSMMIDCIAIMLLFRIDYETRVYKAGIHREVWQS
ncbi:MAG: putative lipid II flippase FtsW [Gammaproteobacteria bacterium]|nr:putative lipid II flippase FtsW [Gammaproteobacteria bacterium]